MVFEVGHQYQNVYFLKIDVSGHSKIVLSNPSDIIQIVFDEIESTIKSTIEHKRNAQQCSYGQFWGWQGDGGLCVIYDINESKALKTALDSSLDILDNKLKIIQRLSQEVEMKGEIHFRIAIHKGSFSYQGEPKQGSIHSKEINLVSHLESKTPKDSISITEDVYDILHGQTRDLFKKMSFDFEGKKIYNHSNSTDCSPYYEWINNISFVGN